MHYIADLSIKISQESNNKALLFRILKHAEYLDFKSCSLAAIMHENYCNFAEMPKKLNPKIFKEKIKVKSKKAKERMRIKKIKRKNYEMASQKLQQIKEEYF